jgi:hypothetical protein
MEKACQRARKAVWQRKKMVQAFFAFFIISKAIAIEVS